MTSGGNNVNYYPENQLTKFCAVQAIMSTFNNGKWGKNGC